MLAGQLTVTKCDTQVIQARAAGGGFEIPFDPLDCRKCASWQLLAKPDDRGFLWSRYNIGCADPEPVVIRCTPKPDVYAELNRAVEGGDWGRATIIASDLHLRTGDADALSKYKSATAQFFSLPEAKAWKTDPRQGKKVATPELVQKIIEFQRDKALPPTGIIDFETARCMAVGGEKEAALGPAPLYRPAGSS